MRTRILSVLAAVTAVATLASGCTSGSGSDDDETSSAPTWVTGVERVSPALAGYRDELLVADLWTREGLSTRDRSLVTVAHLVAADQPLELGSYVDQALDIGVTPAEISETVTHLAFYAGWPDAMAAVPVIDDVFAARGIDADQLPAAGPTLLPLDEEAERTRAEGVEADYGDLAPGMVADTTNVLFLDLWLRPDLAPRDRSLVTVVALVASGQVAQMPFHLNRAMDNGLTETEVGEVLNHLAYYAGWPRVFSAMPVARDVLAGRG